MNKDHLASGLLEECLAVKHVLYISSRPRRAITFIEKTTCGQNRRARFTNIKLIVKSILHR